MITVLLVELHIDFVSFPAQAPAHRASSLRAGDGFAGPVNLKLMGVEAMPSQRLPTRVLTHWADKLNTIFAQASSEELSIGITFIHQMRVWQQVFSG